MLPRGLRGGIPCDMLPRIKNEEEPPMEWCEAIVHTTSAASDVISDWMIRFGATGTEIVDRADVPDPAKPGVYWELYDPKMLAAVRSSTILVCHR